MTVSYATLYLPGSSQGIQVVEGSQLHLIYVAMGANSIPSAPGETVRADPYPQYVDADELSAALAGLAGGDGGAVASVNGQTGAVVLDADDIGEGVTNKAFTLAEKDKLADITPGANVYTDQQVRAVMPAIRSVTGATTLALGDDIVRVNSATAVTVTVPPNSSVAFPVGTVVQVRRRGAGAVTIAAGAGVTINGPLTGAPEYGSYALLKVGTNEWDIEGGQ